LKITNLLTTSNKLHTNFYNFVLERAHKAVPSPSESINEFQSYIQALVSKIEKRLSEKNATPADLAVPSFRIFLWLRFLTNRENLELHLSTMDEFITILSDLKQKSTPDPQHFLLKLNYSSYLYQRKTAQGNTILQINEPLISAPLAIKRSVLAAAFSKRKSGHNQIVRDFITTPEYLRMNERIRGEPTVNKITCRGTAFNLSMLYKKLNVEYFNNQLDQLRLVWSPRESKHRLGYYHSDIHTIAINKKLDKNTIDQDLIEFVLYHEMLHQFKGISHRNGRRYAHTPSFKKAERKFRQFEKAESLIKHLQ